MADDFLTLAYAPKPKPEPLSLIVRPYLSRPLHLQNLLVLSFAAVAQNWQLVQHQEKGRCHGYTQVSA